MMEVLIETYWNVKSGADPLTVNSLRLVLIETYWNVKDGNDHWIDALRYVLIETYWNVKSIKF